MAKTLTGLMATVAVLQASLAPDSPSSQPAAFDFMSATARFSPRYTKTSNDMVSEYDLYDTGASGGYASHDFITNLYDVREPVGMEKESVKGTLGSSSPSAVGYLPRKYRTCDANGIPDNGFMTVLVKICIFKDWTRNTLLFSPGEMMGNGIVANLTDASGEHTYRFELTKGMSIAKFVVPSADGTPIIRYVSQQQPISQGIRYQYGRCCYRRQT
jgi:hypothetical protein